MSLSLARQFKMPKRWNARGPLRARMAYVSDETQSVVGSAITTGIAPIPTATSTNSVLTNNGRQAFNFNAETELSELLSFSVTGSHAISFDRSYNRRVSNTVFSVILQLQFFAGEIR